MNEVNMLDLAKFVAVEPPKVDQTLYRGLAAIPAGDRTRSEETLLSRLKARSEALSSGLPLVDIARLVQLGGWSGRYPTLAVCAARFSQCFCTVPTNGILDFRDRLWAPFWEWRVPMPNMPRAIRLRLVPVRGEALVPLIPLEIRPEGNLSGFLIAWQADWHAAAKPVDPLLLKCFGIDNICGIWATWDVTESEAAALRLVRGI